MLCPAIGILAALTVPGLDVQSQTRNVFESVAFDVTLGGPGADTGNAVVELADGFVVVGYAEFNRQNGIDTYLVRLNANGDTLWTRTYGEAGDDHGWDIVATDDGGFTIVGFTEQTSSGEEDVYVLHTDAMGETVWMQTFGYEKGERAWSMQATPNGDVVIAAQTTRSDEGNIDAYLLRVNKSGQLVWSQVVGGEGIDRVFSVAAMADGGFAFTGFSTATLTSPRDVYVICVDADGNLAWEKRFEGPETDTGHGIIAADDGVLVTGYGASRGAGGNDVYLIRMAGDGSVLWRREIGGAGDDRAMMSATRLGGGFATIGYSDRLGDWDIYLIEIDASGGVISESVLERTGPDRGVMVRTTRDGGYIVTGGVMPTPPPAESWDLIVLKTNGINNK